MGWWGVRGQQPQDGPTLIPPCPVRSPLLPAPRAPLPVAFLSPGWESLEGAKRVWGAYAGGSALLSLECWVRARPVQDDPETRSVRSPCHGPGPSPSLWGAREGCWATLGPGSMAGGLLGRPSVWISRGSDNGVSLSWPQIDVRVRHMCGWYLSRVAPYPSAGFRIREEVAAVRSPSWLRQPAQRSLCLSVCFN